MRIAIPLISMVLISSSLPAAAQKGFITGVKIGVGYTTLHHQPGSTAALSYQYKPGLSMPYGLFGNWQFSRHFSVNMELGYMLAGGVTHDIHPLKGPGSTYPDARLYADCPSETRLRFLTSSVMLRYSHSISKHGYIFAQAGPSPQLLLYADQLDNGYGTKYRKVDDYTAVSGKQYFNELTETTSDFNKWNWAVNCGIGIYWMMEHEFVSIGLNASRGIIPVQKADKDENRSTTGLYYLSATYGWEL